MGVGEVLGGTGGGDLGGDWGGGGDAWGAHVGFACRDMCYDEESLASPLFTLLLFCKCFVNTNLLCLSSGD